MFTSLALATAFAHPGGPHFGWFFLIPIFWILLIGGLIALFATRGRRWRREAAAGGYGPWGHHGPWGAGAQAARGAESTLAERFAQGDIDEKEYRARLEVLRANVPQPPAGPQK